MKAQNFTKYSEIIYKNHIQFTLCPQAYGALLTTKKHYKVQVLDNFFDEEVQP
jgi:hypothetical protein